MQTVALTATATPRVREDIVQVLCLRRPQQFMSGFARPNLDFRVDQQRSDREKEFKLKELLAGNDGSGIIYCSTRKRCEAVVEFLSTKLKLSAGAYHAGLAADQRKAIHERFMKDDLQIVVATNAFGMGIDKPNLRFVIHFNMPGSLEAYYQEAGRAGRDGRQSQCLMLFSHQDRHIQEFFIENNYPERSLIERVYAFLQEREEDPIELTLEQIRDGLGLSVSPEAVGSCLQILSRTRVLERLEMGGGMAMIRIDSPLPTLVDLLPRDAKIRRSVLRLLERVVGDRRGEDVYVHPRWLLQESGMPRDSLARALRELAKLEEVDYVPPFRGRAVHFRKRDVPFNELEIDFENLRERKQSEYDRLNHVVRYAQSPVCRQATILSYFGDSSPDDCGHCDRCGQRPGRQPQAVAGADARSPAPDDASAKGTELLGQRSALEKIVDAIERLHGRLGKHLISQYLCGSQNAKVQKLNLHRLSGFGLLQGLRQTDAVQLIDVMLTAGILRQQEVNRNRPTISVSPELVDLETRGRLLEAIRLPAGLGAKIRHCADAAAPATPKRGTAGADKTARPPSDFSESPFPSGASRATGITEPRAGHAKSGQKADWQWTLILFEQRHKWQDVMQLRRMRDEELAASLCDAVRAGATVAQGWLSSGEGSTARTVGQRRVLREMQRRSADGIP